MKYFLNVLSEGNHNGVYSVEVDSTCPKCGKVTKFWLEEKMWNQWNSGQLIQRCFPYLSAVSREQLIQRCFPSLSADSREQLISGICGPCWIKMFGNGDEE